MVALFAKIELPRLLRYPSYTFAQFKSSEHLLFANVHLWFMSYPERIYMTNLFDD